MSDKNNPVFKQPLMSNLSSNLFTPHLEIFTKCSLIAKSGHGNKTKLNEFTEKIISKLLFMLQG